MARTRIGAAQIRDGGINREDINTNEAGHALITKAVQGDDITLSSTGVDSGTGDVTFSLSIEKNNEIANKVDKIDEHELISVASLIHRARMSIRQDNMNMKLILK
jgi:hypothetical protein